MKSELLCHILYQKFLLLLISIILIAAIITAKSMRHSFMAWQSDFKVSSQKCEAFRVGTQIFPC